MSSVITSIEEEINPKTQLCCRFLEEDEYYKLLDIFIENNDEVPNPKLSRIAVVEEVESKEIIGFFCWQLQAHAEPMYIKEEYRNSGVWIKLIEMILPYTEKKRTYIIAATEQTEIMCEKMGLKRIESPVFVKEI